MYQIITSSRVHKKASWTEQSRKKMYLITYPMVMGSKQMQGQIPTLRVTWSCLELIISHSCGSLLASKSPKSREISLKCLLTVWSKLQGFIPKTTARTPKRARSLSFSCWCSSSHNREVSTQNLHYNPTRILKKLHSIALWFKGEIKY